MSVLLVLGHTAVLIAMFYILAIICDEFFVPALEKISQQLKLSSEFAGATLMAVGSSAPELFTSLFAILNPGVNLNLGAGTIVGSALFNILVIIGASAMVRKVKLSRKPILRDLIAYIVAIGLLLITFRDGQIIWQETVVFIICYFVYVRVAKNRSKRLKYEIEEEPEEEDHDHVVSEKNWLVKSLHFLIHRILVRKNAKNRHRITFFISIAIIGGSTHFMVDSGVFVAHAMGIPEAIIGLTILAAGTSVPDLLSSLVVARKGKGDMAITNAIGSNIFDILFGLGVPYFIYFLINRGVESMKVETANLEASILLLFATVVAVLFILLLQKWHISKKSGIVLILVYLGYLIYSILKIIN